MIENLTVIVPYRNGQDTIGRLLNSLPGDQPVIVVDDQSTAPYQSNRKNVTVIRPESRGYFAGACNTGMNACSTDVLILNQDVWFEGTGWADMITGNREKYAVIGDGVFGHPAWPAGYVQGTCMFIRRDAIQAVGGFNVRDYPLWGATAEYQVRVCRKGLKALPLAEVPGMGHERRRAQTFGTAITAALKDEPDKKSLFIRTPPAVSVVVPCFNYGRYLPDLINSLIGGETCLGVMPGQTFQSFEVVIVDDASTDGITPGVIADLVDDYKAIRAVYLPKNRGTAGANNAGIRASYGKAITILGADDMMEPDRLENLYRAWAAYPDRVIYDDIQLVVNGRRAGVWKMPEFDFEHCLYKNQMHAGIMFGRTAWNETGGYPEQMKYGREDWAYNIKLAISGYCGMHIPGAGYLYRRGDGHNRTDRNAGAEWRQRFLSQMQALYPDVYAGVRTEIMCCGQRKATPQQIQTIKARRAAALPGADGLMLIEYIGGNIGTAPYYGPVTGTRYEAGKKKNLIYIDQQDAVTGNARKPGLLEMKDNGKAVFRKYSPPTAELNISAQEAERVNPGTLAAAAVEIEPEPVPEPEPVKKTRRSRK